MDLPFAPERDAYRQLGDALGEPSLAEVELLGQGRVPSCETGELARGEIRADGDSVDDVAGDDLRVGPRPGAVDERAVGQTAVLALERGELDLAVLHCEIHQPQGRHRMQTVDLAVLR